MIATKKKTGKHSLFTIGYEGLDFPDFLKFLTYHKIELLVDVREIPASRKEGFSKSFLSQALGEAGIDYAHIRALGSPSPIRKQLKADWDYDAFFSAYDDYLEQQDEALNLLNDLIEKNRRVCLMCFEKSHEECHRSRIASHVAHAFQKHLTVEPVNTWVK